MMGLICEGCGERAVPGSARGLAWASSGPRWLPVSVTLGPLVDPAAQPKIPARIRQDNVNNEKREREKGRPIMGLDYSGGVKGGVESE